MFGRGRRNGYTWTTSLMIMALNNQMLLLSPCILNRALRSTHLGFALVRPHLPVHNGRGIFPIRHHRIRGHRMVSTSGWDNDSELPLLRPEGPGALRVFYIRRSCDRCQSGCSASLKYVLVLCILLSSCHLNSVSQALNTAACWGSKNLYTR